MRGLMLLFLFIGITVGLISQLNASSKYKSVSSVRLAKTKDALIVGRTDALRVTIAPTNATNKAVKWYSSNNRIARVDSNPDYSRT